MAFDRHSILKWESCRNRKWWFQSNCSGEWELDSPLPPTGYYVIFKILLEFSSFQMRSKGCHYNCKEHHGDPSRWGLTSQLSFKKGSRSNLQLKSTDSSGVLVLRSSWKHLVSKFPLSCCSVMQNRKWCCGFSVNRVNRMGRMRQKWAEKNELIRKRAASSEIQ